MRFRERVMSWLGRGNHSRAMTHELSESLTLTLMSEWFGAEAVSASSVSPEVGKRIDRTLVALPTINLEVVTQLVLAGMEDPTQWKQHRDLIFGFAYGRAQHWCHECGEESDWPSVFLTLHVALMLLGQYWDESVVTAKFDEYLGSGNEQFEIGRTSAHNSPIGGASGSRPSFPLLQYLTGTNPSK